MTNLILFFGDITSENRNHAVCMDANAFLVDSENIHTIIASEFLQDTVAYTSLGDLPKDINLILRLLAHAKKIVYCPPKSWSSGKSVDYQDVTNSDQGLSEFLLFLIDREFHNVNNLDLSHYGHAQYLALTAQRKGSNRQIWVVGDSNSHAVGVNDQYRYGEILAEKLQMSVSFLTAPGASIEWAADQILRSDIHKDDLVIWGLSDEARMPLWTKSTPWHVTVSSLDRYQHNLLDTNTIGKLLTDETRTYQAITHVYQVVNFCNKIQAKLFVFGLGISDTSALHLHNLKNFSKYRNYQTSTRWIDFGSDNKHPGPQQHQLFADFCVNQLRHLKYIN